MLAADFGPKHERQGHQTSMRSLLLRLADSMMKGAGPEAALWNGLRLLRRHKYEAAIQAFDQAEEQFTAKYGKDHPYVVGAMSQRAFCLVELGRQGEGAQVYREALSRKRQRGDWEPPTPATLERYLAGADARACARD